jgi:hypothetical protein
MIGGKLAERQPEADATVDDALALASLDAVTAAADVTVWEGNRVVGFVQFDRAKDLPVNRVRTDALVPPKPRPKRFCRQDPMMRQTVTFRAPWDLSDEITLEIIALPAGSGSRCEDPAAEENNAPMDRSELDVLQEAGWAEYQGRGITAFVRFIQ